MIQSDGQYHMIDAAELRAALEQPRPDGAIIAYGTEAEIAAIARRVRLGDAELRARRGRRKSQRAARRRNR